MMTPHGIPIPISVKMSEERNNETSEKPSQQLEPVRRRARNILERISEPYRSAT
jgi:hypothetical protein